MWMMVGSITNVCLDVVLCVFTVLKHVGMQERGGLEEWRVRGERVRKGEGGEESRDEEETEMDEYLMGD